jgi:hypothetical protein
LDLDDLFEKFPEILFGSFRKMMLLGIVSAETVRVVLEPLLRNFHEIMAGLSPDLRDDFESILRIYPDVASRFGLQMKPPIGWALSSLLEFPLASGKVSQPVDQAATDIDLDFAAEGQGLFDGRETTSFEYGQGFLTTDQGSAIYLEFSWSIEDDFVYFDHKPSQIEIDIYIYGAYALTLGPNEPGKMKRKKLLDNLPRETRSADILRLVEKIG